MPLLRTVTEFVEQELHERIKAIETSFSADAVIFYWSDCGRG